MKEALDAALGVPTGVRKRRELWRKENVDSHLDTVEGVGQVFEVEAKTTRGHEVEVQVPEYRPIFGPCLDDDIIGSNEDWRQALVSIRSTFAPGLPSLPATPRQ